MKFAPRIARPALRAPALSGSEGQALTEFLVISVALLPLFLLMPMIAKYQDIAHSTQMASRYVAFEAMTRNDAVSSWKPPEQLAAEVRRRFFSNPDAAIKTNDVAGDFKANQNLFWRDPQDAPLIKHFDSDVNVSFGPDHNSDHSGGFTSASDGQPFLLKGPLSLQNRGIYSANVSVTLVNLPGDLKFYKPFDTINLRMSRSTSLLIDGWSGRDPGSVQDKLSNVEIFPGKALAPLSVVVDPVVMVIELPGGITKGPKLGKLDFWQDVVPPDRLRASQ
ncbi:hypothetical protein SAMN04515617_10710 [Collimonas sp. OK242]|uniref:hypothetical protein n=1 Tax=Collimonas sp. OK242 TaxID=1798195 RepID=UPI0008986D10|nr:hypothetical protein [Collimonas sp. OK242]SDX80009.1 hypothetical protein SAMN04515617_10710 [Collimonas sp. OK242]